MVRLQSYSPHSGLLYEPPYIVAAHPSECRENHRDNSRDRETHGAPSLFGPGDRIVDEYTKEEFHVDQYLGKVRRRSFILLLLLLFATVPRAGWT
ncbi:unnamed protein product [Heligmosomoides polygyrus]|uniref:Uncharacterized protein n=1 Tax=Heligmosomoides polygyrus TaxID=6339 RepID=A0A183FX51_HELPZ|nr:unnamed protein product [Heligmosomoides polygyrus]